MTSINAVNTNLLLRIVRGWASCEKQDKDDEKYFRN